MGNLGMPELILILALALLLFGPKKLPEIGKQVGKALGEFKRTSNELKRTIEDEMDRRRSDDPGTDPPSRIRRRWAGAVLAEGAVAEVRRRDRTGDEALVIDRRAAETRTTSSRG